MTASIDTAVRLVKQAILQDSKRNYEEAGRCYREALHLFHQLRRAPQHTTGHRITDFLATKVVQYEERLRAIDAYLLAQNDWTKFFKDIEPCTGDECSNSSSSRSSETRQLYRNPLLVSALESLRRGRKADERYEYRTALESYTTGLNTMQAVINRGILTPRQEAAARAKCLVYHDRAEAIRTALEAGGRLYSPARRCSEESNLSLNSACDSPVPTTEADNLLEMDEVHSCSSRLGSTSSLHQLDRTHAVLHASLPHLAAIPPSSSRMVTPCIAYHRSLYSLHAAAEEAKRQQHSLTGEAQKRGCSVRQTTPPLVCLDAELNISSLSVASRHGHNHIMDNHIMDSATTDTLEVELLNLTGSCEDIKCGEYEESDSGYSDPSPDGAGGQLMRDDNNKTPSDDPATLADRKSMFSDLSEEDEENEEDQHDIFPTVIIKNQEEEGGQQQRVSSPYFAPSPTFTRHYGRQRSVFQTPGKDILTSVVSRDDLAVIGQDSVDAPPTPVPPKDRQQSSSPAGGGGSAAHSRVRSTPAYYNDTYRRTEASGRRPPEEAVPRRATAQKWDEKPEKNGCFYVMTALDFCWCL